MSGPEHDDLLALLRPVPRNESERAELCAQLDVLLEFVRFVIESKSVESVREDAEEEARRLRCIGQSLVNLPEGVKEDHNLLGNAYSLLASGVDRRNELLFSNWKGRGQPPKDRRVIFIARCLDFLQQSGKKVSMHRSGAGTKFVQAVWRNVCPEANDISLEAWAKYWDRHLKGGN